MALVFYRRKWKKLSLEIEKINFAAGTISNMHYHVKSLTSCKYLSAFNIPYALPCQKLDILQVMNTFNRKWRKFLSNFAHICPGPYTEGGGAAVAVAPPPQRKLNLQFLLYSKYIGQDKSCLIFKYIGTLSSFPPWQKSPAYGPVSVSLICETKCKSFPSKSSFVPKMMHGVFICSLLCIYTFMLTVLMLNKFTYSHVHTFNRRNQNYDWESSILCPQTKSRTVTFSFKQPFTT